MVASASWDALGTWCEVLTVHEDDLPDVAELARSRVADVEVAHARWQRESASATGSRAIDPVLADAAAAVLRTAEFTGGLVVPLPGWRAVRLDPDALTLTVPDGEEFGFGPSVHAWAADWIAQACLDELGVGCLVNLGGDIATRGEVPDGGWLVEIDDGRPGPQGHPVISMGWPGGLATSAAAATDAGHRTWRTVTVAARSCERASAACAAAMLLGDAAPRWLSQRELPARLVHTGGVIVQTNGWPQQRWAV
nr:FAD:protein FMN transferase [Propionicimonas sp.]